MKKFYKVECGVLLNLDHDEFECYSNVYDKKNAYYDEEIYITETLEQAKADAESYVQSGVNGTYAVIVELLCKKEDYYSMQDIEEDYVGIFGSENYKEENVIYSLWKVKSKKFTYPNKDGNIVENFVGENMIEKMNKEEK